MPTLELLSLKDSKDAKITCRRLIWWIMGSQLALGLTCGLCSCQSTQIAGKAVDLSSALESAGKLASDAKAKEIADALAALEANQVTESDRGKANDLEARLLLRLRDQVKKEVLALHQGALKSPSYKEGYALAREAGAVIALYPLADDPATVSEADELSLRQNEVIRRLELIRRQRYNFWAAQQLEKSLAELREKELDSAQATLGTIDPSLLETAVSSLYSYAVNEIMDKLGKEAKASLAKTLTKSSTVRRGLEDF